MNFDERLSFFQVLGTEHNAGKKRTDCGKKKEVPMRASTKPERGWRKLVIDPISTHDTEIVIRQSQHAVNTSMTLD